MKIGVKACVLIGFNTQTSPAKVSSVATSAGLLAQGSVYLPRLPILFFMNSGNVRLSSPFTVAGLLPVFTGFPFQLCVDEPNVHITKAPKLCFLKELNKYKKLNPDCQYTFFCFLQKPIF